MGHENQVREKIGAELDEEIARKQDKANRENGNAILSSAAKLLGKGKQIWLTIWYAVGWEEKK